MSLRCQLYTACICCGMLWWGAVAVCGMLSSKPIARHCCCRMIISFRECYSRCRFQPYDCVIIRLVAQIQSAIKFCQCARVDNVVHGLSLPTITGRWLGETPSVQVSTTWALTCSETVHQSQTLMGQTNARPFHRPCSAYYVSKCKHLFTLTAPVMWIITHCVHEKSCKYVYVCGQDEH